MTSLARSEHRRRGLARATACPALALALALPPALLQACTTVRADHLAKSAALGPAVRTDDGAEQAFAAGLSETWTAALGALHELDYPVGIADEPPPPGGTIQTADVSVRVRAQAPGATRVAVAVGGHLSERRALEILGEMAARLARQDAAG